MSTIQFAVSAKTARLIGRENISNVDGAIIELVKNSYDADATCVHITFNIPFPSVPNTITYQLCHTVFSDEEIAKLLDFYFDSNNQLEKKKSLSFEQEQELEKFLNEKNTIIVMDNGIGMTEEILRTAWMNIGTNDKEERRISDKGRVKTGAKGIGRFALDKLSTSTTVITKNKNDTLKKWHIDWNQFESAILIEEVTATIEDCEGTFFDFAYNIFNPRFKVFSNYQWDSGTIITLSPTRENWSEWYFSKVNKNLRSIFPSTNNSQFDIFINNVFYPDYSFTNERFFLDNSDYDYKISANFDGKDSLEICIERNEIDTRKLKTIIKQGDKTFSVPLSDFWRREVFTKEPYLRSSFAKKVTFQYSVSSLTKIEPSRLETTGPFSLKFYFLKNTSSTIDIVKPVSASKRRKILSNYSGIKLYRDGFKVRPYGEEDGPSFDWLSLNVRVQKSPAAVSHPTGSWRVRSNQIIGEVRISKDDNPNLSDMANREGLASNDAFAIFKTIIEKVIETFEADRQIVYREFALWIKQREKEYFDPDKIISDIKQREKEGNDNNPLQEAIITDKSSLGKNEKNHTQTDYEKTILDLDEQKNRQVRANKTLMLYSSAGVMTNTFSHEISRIMTQAGSRMQHLRYAVKRLLGDEGYKGPQIFNPMPIIDQAEAVDTLLENWLAVIMSGVNERVFEKQELNIPEVLDKHLSTWKPLMDKKMITIQPLIIHGNIKDLICNIAEIDLLIILNNFMLNSSYFLEKSQSSEHIITITVNERESNIIIELENNGLPLDGVFANNPDRIFEPGVSTKMTDEGKGSGIGLWITKTLVLDNGGEIHPMQRVEGFGLRISFPK